MSNKDKAQGLKQEGNDAYKRKDFTKASDKFQSAIDLDPTEITYYTNLAAVHFETKAYQECVNTCMKAIDVGRENRADFKLIAKALSRMGKAYNKLGDLYGAKSAYEKALTEHRTPEYRTALSEIENQIKKKEAEDYINQEIAEQEKQNGSDLFNSGDFSGAVKHYTEAIRRNPSNAKLYSNRASCFTKLMSFDLALKDCDKCIELEPEFVKAYLRKAKVHAGIGQTNKAMAAYEKAIELDPNCSEAIKGYKNAAIQSHSDPEETRRRAMNDPEIQKIFNDPAMRVDQQDINIEGITVPTKSTGPNVGRIQDIKTETHDSLIVGPDVPFNLEKLDGSDEFKRAIELEASMLSKDEKLEQNPDAISVKPESDKADEEPKKNFNPIYHGEYKITKTFGSDLKQYPHLDPDWSKLDEDELKESKNRLLKRVETLGFQRHTMTVSRKLEKEIELLECVQIFAAMAQNVAEKAQDSGSYNEIHLSQVNASKMTYRAGQERILDHLQEAREAELRHNRKSLESGSSVSLFVRRCGCFKKKTGSIIKHVLKHCSLNIKIAKKNLHNYFY